MSNASPERAALAQRALEARFKITRFGVGYGLDDVDLFLDEVSAQLRDDSSPEEILALLGSANFRQTRWRDGYSTEQVDAFLNEMAANVRALYSLPESSVSPERAALAQSVIESRFTITKFRIGYDLDNVDDFLDTLVAGIGKGVGPAELLALLGNASFQQTRMRDGYDTEQVDAFLNETAGKIRALNAAQ